ncbi:MAG: class I SAM-dependent methyltransferase [Bacteroidetes bacterium]|nr:class I SAM-dependent methyltransferase [Bacteroidota bacterium]
MKCRHCQSDLKHIFVDLVNCPPSNAMLNEAQLNEPEVFYPLKIFVCDQCWLVQVDEMKSSQEIFDNEYTYFSSFSTSWLAHAKKYVDYMTERFGFNSESQVIEIASNDGYLLQYFKEKGIPVLGVEPTANTAAAAAEKGIESIVEFFGTNFSQERLVDRGIKADLILGNNVLAHVPDINDFVQGMKRALKEEGVITMEFPHLMKLVEENQFDTIYHEHFSYISFHAVSRVFESQGLEMFDVQEIPTHGGSLRIFAKHKEDKTKEISSNVAELLAKEAKAGMTTLEYYEGFQEVVDKIKYDAWSFLIEQKRAGKKVVGYGAAAKGNTLLNYCGIKGNDLISFVSDASPHKQDKYLPAARIPVLAPDKIREYQPDYVIIFPWNLSKEIGEQLSYIRDWDGKFAVFIPELTIF